MNDSDEEACQRIREMLLDEYMLSMHRSGEMCQNLLVRTYKHFNIQYGNVKVRERRVEYDKAHRAKKEAGKKEHTG